MRAGPRPHRHRLAHVERQAAHVAEHVDARDRRAARCRSGRSSRGTARPRFRSRPARPRRGGEHAPPRRRRCPPTRIASGRARRTHTRRSRRRRARDAPPRPRCPASRPARRACAGVASGAKRHAIATVQSDGGSGQRAPRARTPAAARGGRTRRCGPPGPGPRGVRPISGSTSSGGGAASTIACVMPVKRSMPREKSGRSTARDRVVAVVQLAAADQHRAHLRELAEIARRGRSSRCRCRRTQRPPRLSRPDPRADMVSPGAGRGKKNRGMCRASQAGVMRGRTY